jgi:hypothetical protein
VNCCHQCRYTYERNTEATSDSSTEAKDDAFHEDWIQQGTAYINCSSHVSIDIELATRCVSSVVKSCDECQGSKSSNIEEDGDKREPEPVPNSTNAHNAYTTLSLSLSHSDTCTLASIHVISSHTEWNILCLKLALFHTKHKIPTKQFSFTEFCG